MNLFVVGGRISSRRASSLVMRCRSLSISIYRQRRDGDNSLSTIVGTNDSSKCVRRSPLQTAQITTGRPIGLNRDRVKERQQSCFFSSESRPSVKRQQNAPKTYSIAKISSDGKVAMSSLPVAEILRGSAMNARDLFSLALTSNCDQQRQQQRHDHYQTDKKVGGGWRPPAVILPRGQEIVMSFGNVRAVIGRDSAMIFDAHNPSIQLLTLELSKLFFAKIKEETLANSTSSLTGKDDCNGKQYNYVGEDPFEIVFVEMILRDVCNTFHRRLRLYEPIVDNLLSRVSNEVFSDSGVHRLVPIKDSLQEFEMHVNQGLQCLTHLLHNDEDMLGILLTEKAVARNNGTDVEHRLHESVELLFEEYARQLHGVLAEINYLLRRVQTKQELVAISLDAYRNRMIRMNVYLSIVGVGLASSTTVAGFFGMNLIHGLEKSPLIAFTYVVMGTTMVGVCLFVGCASYLSGERMRKRAVASLDEIGTIHGALSDMSAVDYAVKVMIDSNEPMSKEKFKEKLMECRRLVKKEELDLLFDVLDVSNDGTLYHDDFRNIENFVHKPPKS